MLCEISLWGNFWTTWVFLTIVGWVSLMAMSLLLFLKFYVMPTYDWWQYKSNPEFPDATKVKQEIKIMTKGLVTATLCPSLSLYLAQQGISKAYCGFTEEFGWGYHFATFLLIWIGTDFWEFLWHYGGHSVPTLWKAHKPHHQFFNPSPFAVIADEYLDQFMRALPLLAFPLVMPINMDMIFFEYALFFYGYGVYLHWGYEFKYPDAHHPFLNTSFQHYIHHALSIMDKPYHTGFFFKLWDNLFGSVYKPAPGKCACAACCRKRGERTPEAWAKVKKPDYSVLLQLSFWLK